jgi:hypothetical protein
MTQNGSIKRRQEEEAYGAHISKFRAIDRRIF